VIQFQDLIPLTLPSVFAALRRMGPNPLPVNRARESKNPLSPLRAIVCTHLFYLIPTVGVIQMPHRRADTVIGRPPAGWTVSFCTGQGLHSAVQVKRKRCSSRASAITAS
jgi:hypothetical protein